MEFAEGLELYNNQEYAEALPHLYRAHELDNSFVVALFHAALCESNLGSGVAYDSLIRVVLQNRDRLSPYYVLRSESYLAKLTGDREAGIEFAREAAELAPGTKALYNLAYDLMAVNRPMEARTALLGLDPDREPMKGWYGYFGVLSSANHLLGRHEEELAVAREARERYPEARASFVRLVEALGALGMTEELDAVFEEAAASPATGAGNTVGALMIIAAAELKAHGHNQSGNELYDRAVEWYEEAGESVSGVAHRTWLTTALIGANRWQDAAGVCDEILEENPDHVWCHGTAGTIAAALGNRERLEAEKAWFVEQAPGRGATFLPLNMAFFEVMDGNVEEGVALLERAMSQGTAFNLWWHRYPGMEDVLAHPAWKELLRPKG